MTRSIAGIALVCVTLCISMSGQRRDPNLEHADLAWDRGDYPAALQAYLTLLQSPEAERYLEPIALQTGELFRTIELTSDGGAPRFSPDGRHFTYEVGRGITRTTRLVSSEFPQNVLAELPGYGAVFSPDASRLAYVKLAVTHEMRELERAADHVAGTERTERLGALARLTETAARIAIRDVSSGAEREIDPGRRKKALLLAVDDRVLFTGHDGTGADQVYLVAPGRDATALTGGEADKILHELNAQGTSAIFVERVQSGRGRNVDAPPRFGVVALPGGEVTMVEGSAPTFSRDGSRFAYVTRTGTQSQLLHAPSDSPASPTLVRTGPERLDAPAWAPGGSRLAFQIMPMHDWELHVIGRDGLDEHRITREIQHDLAPRFLDGSRLLGSIGEARHRRSYLYELPTNRRTRLFHNNTVRTIAAEYAWSPSPDGTQILVVADRDGNTVSPERGVYLTDLARKVTIEEVRTRVAGNLAAEQALRARGARLYSPIADRVRQVVAAVSVARIFAYQKALVDFDSRHISRPGNRRAAEYLVDTYRSFGYAPQYQWIRVPTALGGQTANVLATLKGTTNPELVYVVGSHYDSIADGPGADDNSSGTAALLETARILARHPQPATIVFASFTGEEGELVGSREFARRSLADGIRVVGALNNDMIGWTNDHRLDNTIRYSNQGIRDVQHAGAMQFSSLITYDALYHRGTDAQAYFEAFGDIVGGIGSYPVLGSPHYHQAHDTLETINHQLVAEVVKTTSATLMLLASSPSPVKDLTSARHQNGTATITWRPSPEKGISSYIVSWGPPDRPESQQTRVTNPTATIDAPPGWVVSVKAVNEAGLEGWDATRARID